MCAVETELISVVRHRRLDKCLLKDDNTEVGVCVCAGGACRMVVFLSLLSCCGID